MQIALTGGIGEGKSTVLAMLEQMGFEVASADAAARQVFGLPDVQRALCRLIGREGDLTPDQLRRGLAEAPGLRRQVNRVMHPLIMQSLYESGATFVEVPLLFEACLYGGFERVWVITCGPEEQLRRLVLRYGDEGHARQMMYTQMRSSAKEVFADVVVRTNQDFETVRSELVKAVVGIVA